MIEPLISGICVSHPSRLGLLQRAVVNFVTQKYTNKELVIVVSENGYYDTIRSFLDSLDTGKGLPELKVRFVPFVSPLSGFLNGMAMASGEWIACWDDDNLSHPGRLGWQLAHTSRQRPSLLSESMYYFYQNEELYITDYAQPAGKLSERCAVASMMFHRSAFKGIVVDKRTIPWTVAMLSRLGFSYDLLARRPDLFIVGANGNNLRGIAAHRWMGTELPATWTAAQVEARGQEIESWLKHYLFPSSTVSVCGKDGPAIEITGLGVWLPWMASTELPDNIEKWIPNEAVAMSLRATKRARRQQEGQ